MGKLFGTDGIRGVVGKNLTAELAYQVGQAVCAVLQENLERKSALPSVKIHAFLLICWNLPCAQASALWAVMLCCWARFLRLLLPF